MCYDEGGDLIYFTKRLVVCVARLAWREVVGGGLHGLGRWEVVGGGMDGLGGVGGLRVGRGR